MPPVGGFGAAHASERLPGILAPVGFLSWDRALVFCPGSERAPHSAPTFPVGLCREAVCTPTAVASRRDLTEGRAGPTATTEARALSPVASAPLGLRPGVYAHLCLFMRLLPAAISVCGCAYMRRRTTAVTCNQRGGASGFAAERQDTSGPWEAGDTPGSSAAAARPERTAWITVTPRSVPRYHTDVRWQECDV